MTLAVFSLLLLHAPALHVHGVKHRGKDEPVHKTQHTSPHDAPDRITGKSWKRRLQRQQMELDHGRIHHCVAPKKAQDIKKNKKDADACGVFVEHAVFHKNSHEELMSK